MQHHCSNLFQVLHTVQMQLTNLHEVASCDSLPDVDIVILVPEVCALHLHSHACADADLHHSHVWEQQTAGMKTTHSKILECHAARHKAVNCSEHAQQHAFKQPAAIMRKP